MRVIMQTLKQVTVSLRVLALLEKRSFADDTVLVYTADHGIFVENLRFIFGLKSAADGAMANRITGSFVYVSEFS